MGKKPLKEAKCTGTVFSIVNRGPVRRDDLVQVEYIPDPSEIIGGRVDLGGTESCNSRQLDTGQALDGTAHTHTST